MSVMLFLGKKYLHILQFRMLKVLGKKNHARFPLLYRGRESRHHGLISRPATGYSL